MIYFQLKTLLWGKSFNYNIVHNRLRSYWYFSVNIWAVRYINLLQFSLIKICISLIFFYVCSSVELFAKQSIIVVHYIFLSTILVRDFNKFSQKYCFNLVYQTERWYLWFYYENNSELECWQSLYSIDFLLIGGFLNYKNMNFKENAIQIQWFIGHNM